MTRRTLAITALGTVPALAKSRFDAGFATARETCNAILRKRISVTELLQMTFRRIDRYNPKLNAIIVEFRERAMVRAKEADAALARGKLWGPLHGVPVTIKEAFAYKGSPNTWGREELKGTNSTRTAAAVERLESAGAIVIGKTNLPRNLSDIQSHNSIYGTTNNPWDLTRTPGGSSGGAAAAVAAGFGPLALGSDSGGSIRTPAHLCGVYGHKPSIGIVSLAGHQAGPWDGKQEAVIGGDTAVAGPLTRDARDLALVLSVLGGPDGDERIAWTWRLPPSRHKRLRDFRIGYITTGEPGAPVSSELAKVYDNLLSTLSRMGAKLERGWPEGIDRRSQLETFTFLGNSRANLSEEQVERYRRRLEKSPNDAFALSVVGPHRRWVVEVERQHRFRAIWQSYFETHDMFLLPPAGTVAFPHNHHEPSWERKIEIPEGKFAGNQLFLWSVFASLPGLPATVAPVGFTDTGLPAGIEIIAPMWEDRTAIEFATLLADCVGGFAPPPGLDT